MARLRRHTSRRSTRRLSQGWRGGALKKILLTFICVVGILIVALVWGLHLKAKSDALAQAQAAGEWTLEENITTPIIHVGTPVLRAGYAPPGGSLQKTQEDSVYGGVVIQLGSCTTALPYTLGEVDIGVSYASGAPDLASHVSALKAKGLYVIGVFDVTSLDTADIALRTYRQGLEMSLLTLFAKAGVSDILLRGMPLGDDTKDAMAVDYIKAVKNLWATMPQATPALGVALLPIALQSDTSQADGTPIYAGELTPARLLKVCDYLALDTAGYHTTATIDPLLRGMQYAYVRYGLRLLMSRSHGEAVKHASECGFGRILECK